MLKKKVAYKDFNGERQTKDLYFNLTEAEAVRLDVSFPGGLEAHIESFDPEVRPEDILNLFEKVIMMAHGVKSEDGQRFIKTEEAAKLFRSSAAYSSLFMDLIQDVDQAKEFFNSMLSTTTVGNRPKPKKRRRRNENDQAESENTNSESGNE